MGTWGEFAMNMLILLSGMMLGYIKGKGLI